MNQNGLVLNPQLPNHSTPRISIDMLGIQPGMLIGRDQTETHTNYYIGSDPTRWNLNVRSYRELQYGNIYKGIDLSYHGNGSQLEYDFVLSPGADPDQIRMRFDGLIPKLHQDGLAFGNDCPLSVRGLRAYQVINNEITEVTAAWHVQGDEATIRLGPYDRKHELVIDPVISYGTYIGGSDSESAISILPAATANVYYIALASTSASITEPAQEPGQTAAANPNPSGTDTLILELDATDSPLATGSSTFTLPLVKSATYIGGSNGATVPLAMTEDSAFNLYVTGTTSNPSSFPQLGTQVCSSACPSYIVKLDPSLNLQYSFGLPATSSNGIALDTVGDVYLTGSAKAGSLTIPMADSAFQSQVTAGSALTNGNHAFLLG